MLLRLALRLILALLVTAPAVARPFTPQNLVSLSRVSDPAVSPDGRWLVWQQRETDLAANKGRYDLWRLDLSRRGSAPAKIASLAEADEIAPAFAADGSLYFLSDRNGGKAAVYRTTMTGAATATAVTDARHDLAGFKLSPRGDALLVWADRPVGARDLDAAKLKPAADAGSARTYDQLFVRHWDAWADGQRSQLFVLPLRNGRAAGAGRAIAGGLVGDAPSKPFGDGNEVAWSPDGRTIYFALREAGRIEPLSTNLDIFAVPADGSAPPTNLTADNKATDTIPAVSPDGRWLAWAAMKRPGYESDRQVVMVRDLASGAVRALTETWDRSAASIAWSRDSRSLYVVAEDVGDAPVFRVDLADGKPHRMTGEGHAANVVATARGFVMTLDSLTAPADLWSVDSRAQAARLTSVNAGRLAGIDLPTWTHFNFKGADGDTVWGYAVKPAGLAEGAKAPIAFLVHGGPQGSFNNSWSYRWNPAVWAGHGLGVVMVDFHGSTGYGQAFTDAIRQEWGGKPLTDLKAGLKAATDRFAWLDADRACAAGASYGGFMMNWIAGNWPDRFRCIVTHDGVFDARAMAYETEELWFDEWEHGGHAYFERPAEYERWNPVNHVDQWRTPMLVIHGGRDYRIPDTQGLAVFTAAQRRGVPSRLVYFPDENHWVLKPRNSLQWHDEVLGWVDKWIAAPAG